MRSLISLTFDDGLRCQFEQALPILDRHGLPATFFLVANSDLFLFDGLPHPDWKKADWNEKDIQLFKDMMRRGHEIGAHGVHHCHPYLDQNPKLEAEGSKKWIEDRLGAEISSYCYPFCHFNESIKRAVISAGYRQARWGANGTYYPWHESFDHFKVDCRHVGKGGVENVADWLRLDCWHVLMYHGIGSENDGWSPISIAEFARQMAELAKYRDAGAVEVVTFHAGAQALSHEQRSRVKRRAPAPDAPKVDIAAIVCTYNRCQVLAKNLESLAAQVVPSTVKWEVLVVDNNSTDQTRAVVEEFSRRYPGRFRYVFEPQQGLSQARNCGVRKVQSDVLAFIDDDAVAEPGWLWNLSAELLAGGWGGSAGPIIPVWPRPLPSWLSTGDPDTMGVYSKFDLGRDAKPMRRPPYGGNMAFRWETFERFGGFRTDLGRSGLNLQGREDLEFGNRLLAGGEQFRYEPLASVRHPVAEHRMTKKYALRWWFGYGRSEVVDVGPPTDSGRVVAGIPIYLFRRLLRWALQSLIPADAPRRFICQRNVFYLAGTIAACYQLRGAS
jgi:peptidoglycan/xylan/chitin deacetylase (PgdA/CDA1 family)/GT2 family glycosyltransferase